MATLGMIGLGLILLASDPPGAPPPSSIRPAVPAGPRIRHISTVTAVGAGVRAIEFVRTQDGPLPQQQSVSAFYPGTWYWPDWTVRLLLHKDNAYPEVFWMTGDPEVLEKYAQNKNYTKIHLKDDTVTSAAGWTVTAASWNDSGWLKVEATHGAISPLMAPRTGRGLPSPQAPSKSLPPAFPSDQLPPGGPAPAPSGPIGGTLTVTLDPIDDVAPAPVSVLCVYMAAP